jgi:AAA domain/RepB DNA-primase from phage plasmid/Primase C terminal 1 (PriCT-1)
MMEQQVSIAQFPAINREDVQRFLSVLDNRTTRFTFMAFDDDENRRDKRLIRILHGTLDELFPTLVDYSRRGCGIFVTINTTNFRGRTKDCIVEVRAYFADLDGAPIENIQRLDLTPHIITATSPGRYGVYYMIDDAPLSAENFKKTQQTLASLFDGDRSVCDLPRVMRLPGFPHQKDPKHPFLTKIDFDTSQNAIEGTTPIYTEATFQEALAKAIAARAPRRSVHTALASGLQSSPLDWSKGVAEGQRNNECARRAGSCLARGMGVEATLEECLRWNDKNDPPLAQSEVEAIIASIARTEAKKQNAGHLISDIAIGLQSPEFVFDSEAPIDPPPMLIKKLLPVSGIAFIGGQSSAGKTFVAVALGVALASGKEFFKYQVKERIGVLYIAAEGAANFGARVTAAKLAADIKGPIPFAWTHIVPPLQTQPELTAFAHKLQVLGREMQQRWGIRLGAVFIDTVAACFSMQDENSNAEVSRVCASMRYIGDSIGIVVIPIHHFGKDAGTGLRGASAWRGTADVVISVTGDIDPLSGRTHNRALAIAKARDAEQGPIAPFRLDYVKLGIDGDGEEFGSCVVREDPERPKNVPRSQVPKWVPAFDMACKRALLEHSEELTTVGGKVRAVELRHVRANFCGTYVTGDEDLKKARQASERAWRRALEKIPNQLPGYATARTGDGREWLWVTADNSRWR